MKAVVLAVGVLGFAGLSGAQTPAPAPQEGIHADSVRVEGRTIQLRGGVRIRLGAGQITADEADLDQDTREFQLRGNVRMLMSLPTPNPR